MHQVHSHNHNHTHDHSDVKNITVALLLNVVFTIIEFIGGYLTNSMAILSDAVHDFGDSISLGMAWYFQKLSKKKSDTHFSYGYKRFSLLGALINAIVLSVGSILILFKTVPRLLHPEETMASGMFWLSILGIIINGAAVIRLKKGKSLNEKVVSLHLLEDVLGWVAIFIGSILIYFFHWYFIDPLLSILISFYILKNVYGNIRQTMKIILQGVPDEIDPDIIKSRLNSLEEIKDVHDLHIWSVDGNYHVLSVHLVLKVTPVVSELGILKSKIRESLIAMDIEHATIEFELPGEYCKFESCSF